MKRLVGAVIIGGVIGLAAGYFFFGEIAGVRINLSDLLPVTDGGIAGKIGRAAQSLTGIERIRRNILLTGAGGAVIAALGALYSRRS
ncbi:MAG: hypothetical protein WCY01_14415 [Alkalispirochaeta sp.]